MAEKININGLDYKAERLLGTGGHSRTRLVSRNGNFFALKEFETAEDARRDAADYRRLKEIRVLTPELIEDDSKNARLLKEYIEGETVAELIARKALQEEYLAQLAYMLDVTKEAGLNLNYAPENFAVQRGILYCVDYETRPYTEEESFEKEGLALWSRP